MESIFLKTKPRFFFDNCIFRLISLKSLVFQGKGFEFFDSFLSILNF